MEFLVLYLKPISFQINVAIPVFKINWIKQMIIYLLIYLWYLILWIILEFYFTFGIMVRNSFLFCFVICVIAVFVTLTNSAGETFLIIADAPFLSCSKVRIFKCAFYIVWCFIMGKIPLHIRNAPNFVLSLLLRFQFFSIYLQFSSFLVICVYIIRV